MIKTLLPLLSVLVAAGLLVAYHLGWISGDVLVGVAVALPLPGLPDLVRALRQRAGATITLPANTELTLLNQLGELSLRWSAQPTSKQQAAELLAILDQHMDRAEAALPAALRPPTPPRPRPGELVLLLALLVLQPACALRGALLACAASEVAPAVSTAAELALHQGEGWQDALARLVVRAGECAVRAAVRAVAERPVGAAPATLVAAAGVSPQDVQLRAQAWLQGRR